MMDSYATDYYDISYPGLILQVERESERDGERVCVCERECVYVRQREGRIEGQL